MPRRIITYELDDAPEPQNKCTNLWKFDRDTLHNLCQEREIAVWSESGGPLKADFIAALFLWEKEVPREDWARVRPFMVNFVALTHEEMQEVAREHLGLTGAGQKAAICDAVIDHFMSGEPVPKLNLDRTITLKPTRGVTSTASSREAAARALLQACGILEPKPQPAAAKAEAEMMDNIRTLLHGKPAAPATEQPSSMEALSSIFEQLGISENAQPKSKKGKVTAKPLPKDGKRRANKKEQNLIDLHHDECDPDDIVLNDQILSQEVARKVAQHLKAIFPTLATPAAPDDIVLNDRTLSQDAARKVAQHLKAMFPTLATPAAPATLPALAISAPYHGAYQPACPTYAQPYASTPYNAQYPSPSYAPGAPAWPGAPAAPALAPGTPAQDNTTLEMYKLAVDFKAQYPHMFS